MVSDFSEDVATSAEGTDANNGNTRTVTDRHSSTVELVLDPIALGSLRRNNVIEETCINGFNVNACLSRSQSFICRQLKPTTALIVVDDQGSFVPQWRVHHSIDDLLLKPGTYSKGELFRHHSTLQIMYFVLLAHRP